MRHLVRDVRLGSRAYLHRLAKGTFARFGYDFEVFPRSSEDAAVTRTIDQDAFYREWCTTSPIWAPWLGDGGFRTAYHGVEPFTVVSSDRCYVLYSLSSQAALLDGDFAECGVYQGGTALLLTRVLENCGATFYLFDSFQGLPRGDHSLDSLGEGMFKATSAAAVGKLLKDFRGNVELREGWMPETFGGLEDRRFAFVHVDVDLYQSALSCCEFFYPRLVGGGVMLFDDYGFPGARGEKEAVDEFFAGRPEIPIALPTGQAVVTKITKEAVS
jgi:O-methyltransferase